MYTHVKGAVSYRKKIQGFVGSAVTYKLKLTDIQTDQTSKINIFYDKEIW